MPKNPNGGPGGPFDPSQPLSEGEPMQAMGGDQRRGPGRQSGQGDLRPADAPTDGMSDSAAAGAPGAGVNAGGGADPAAARGQGGRTINERKKQFVIAPRQLGGLGPQGMGLQPLQLSTVEQALRSSPDIEIIDTITPRSVVGTLADGMGGAQGILVARMTEQKAVTLHQQAQGRLLVERDQYLALMDPVLHPTYVSNVVPTSGPAFTATISVVDKDGAPVPECEVSLFGSMLPASAVTDGGGQAVVSLFGESASSIRGLYVKPKADFWSFYNRDPDLSAEDANVVTLRALADWPSLAGLSRQKTVGWGQKAMRMDQLPEHFRGQGIRIAVIDSGIATSHDSLKGVRAGFDIVNKRTNPNTWNEDTLGHGTHCAGVIGAADLASGIRGFAPEAEIHACKLFPGGQVSQLIDALEYCIEKQIDVVNLSLGGAEPSEALEQQLIRARRAGVACIVAAGNSGGPVQYPAASPNVLAVSAIGKLDEFPSDSYHAQTLTANVDANGYYSASFSCFGPQVGVCGPGVAITSTVPPNNYAAWDGTSMAAPHITGLAALVLAHHPEFQSVYRARTAERVERLFQHIRASARRVSQADATRVGLGLPDAMVAVGLQPALGTAAQLPFGSAAAGSGGAVGSALGGAVGAPMGGVAGIAGPGMGGLPAQGGLAGFMGQSPIGQQVPAGWGSTPFDQIGLDQAMAAYASGYLPGWSLQQIAALAGMPLGGMPLGGLPLGMGNPGFPRSW